MDTLTLPPASVPMIQSAPETCWRVTVTAEPEPLLLARVLQKFAVPEIAVLTAHYEADAGGEARVELRIRARSDRARLAVVRTLKLLSVRQARLAAADSL